MVTKLFGILLTRLGRNKMAFIWTNDGLLINADMHHLASMD